MFFFILIVRWISPSGNYSSCIIASVAEFSRADLSFGQQKGKCPFLGIGFTSPKQISVRIYIPNSWAMWNIGTFTTPCKFAPTRVYLVFSCTNRPSFPQDLGRNSATHPQCPWPKTLGSWDQQNMVAISPSASPGSLHVQQWFLCASCVIAAYSSYSIISYTNHIYIYWIHV